ALPQASSASLAAQLLGHLTTASQAVARAERQLQLQQALNVMDPMDREIIALRHFEELSNGDAAAVLGLSKGAASKRYVRAMPRLRPVWGRAPDPLDGDGDGPPAGVPAPADGVGAPGAVGLAPTRLARTGETAVTDSAADRDGVEALAEAFLERHRCGER